jgi:hypothetical protein
MTVVQPTTDPVPRSPAAERMRRHRSRKRKGLRCVSVQLRETEIDVLIKMGLLTADARNDRQCAENPQPKHPIEIATILRQRKEMAETSLRVLDGSVPNCAK